jgi:hypothetical protein
MVNWISIVIIKTSSDKKHLFLGVEFIFIEPSFSRSVILSYL